MVAHNLTKAVDKRSIMYKILVGVASLSVFGGNFVLAKPKVHLGLITVRCLEWRGIQFSDV